MLRRTLFEQTGGMFPELVTRPDSQVFLPPIGGITVYLFGDVDQARPTPKRRSPAASMTNATAPTCSAPTSAPAGLISCTASRNARASAQEGGLGIIVYNRKEGRALGEVTKFLVYNARKRQEGGDAAAAYFERTECVAGVQDTRFQELMPDVIHWLGITRIDRFVSMSEHEIRRDGRAPAIEIVERVPIPDELIPADAHVEMDAKKAAGYYLAGRTGAARPGKHDGPRARQVLKQASGADVVPAIYKIYSRISRWRLPMNPEASAAFSLLSAEAVRSRAQRMLAIGSTADCRIFVSICR